MTRKEIQKVIIDNPSKQLYIRHSSGIIDFHERVSKTRVLENSKYIFSFRVSTYGEERPDLVRFSHTPDTRELVGWDNEIVTFFAGDN